MGNGTMAENDPNVFFGALGLAAVVIVLMLAVGMIEWPDPQVRAAADKAKFDEGYAAGHAAGVQEGGRAARIFKCATSR